MRTSTATGLFQFIEQTWLATLKQAGPAFGYGRYADAISRTTSGRYVVEDPALRAEIMQLRKDPTANALMGGVFTQQNAAVLAQRLGRAPSEGELYIAHFLGPCGAAKAITLAPSNPNANAAEIFPGGGATPIGRSSTTSRATRAASPASAPNWRAAIRSRAPSSAPAAIAAAQQMPTRPPVPAGRCERAQRSRRRQPTPWLRIDRFAALARGDRATAARVVAAGDRQIDAGDSPGRRRTPSAGAPCFIALFQTGAATRADRRPRSRELWSGEPTRDAIAEARGELDAGIASSAH